MFQAIGLTKSYRRGRPPAVLDLSFDARPGQVTVLLGPVGSGRTTALLLALGLERGQGTALFDGRPYRRIKRPEREVGAVLAEQYRCPRHPGRRARAHLRMVAAATGVPARRADQLLEQTRLAPAAEDRLRTFSPGMNRRLALAEALLADPGTLLLDEPTHELSPKNVEWFHAVLRAFAAGGGTVLMALRSPQEAAALADRVVTLEQGRLLADEPAGEFLRTRLQDEVSVSGPQVGRLADLLTEGGARVRRESGTRISVSGASRTEIGELAYRHGVLLHELTDHVVTRPAPRPVGATAAAPGNPGNPLAPPTPTPPTPTPPTPTPPTPTPLPTAVVAAPAAAAAERQAVVGAGETVVVLTPGSAVTASVVAQSGQHESGQHESGQHESGQHDSGQYGSGPHQAEQHRAGQHQPVGGEA
jgi:ABC-2 type transport system ATP-binding protein